MRDAPPRFSAVAKALLAVRVWVTFARVYLGVRKEPLPVVVERIGRVTPRAGVRVDARRMGRIVSRLLRIGPLRARCLFTSLVLFRLLREQGDVPTLVIGLPREPRDKDAHAWIEVDGHDVGPPPGKGLHQELARFA